MNLSVIFPPEAIQWLIRYGLFSAFVLFAGLVLALLMRPFWLWFTGRAEELDRLKRLEETSRKALLELEVLNQTLSIPVKRASQKARAEEKTEAPMVVTQEAKDAFLKVLENSRKTIRDAEDEPEPKS